MKNALDLFQKLTSELLSDEADNPVARHIPSQDLYKQLDLSLKEQPLAEDAGRQARGYG